MKNRNITIVLFMLLLLGAKFANAQGKTEIGITAGVARFNPEMIHYSIYTSLDQMDKGAGWTAGAFIQRYLTPKVQPIIEINYVSLSSDIAMQQVSEGTGEWQYGDDQPSSIYREFRNTSFPSLSASLGTKYYLTKKLIAYPAFVVARSLNQDMYNNKTDYRVKLGLGLKLKKTHVILEYAYGLRDQSHVLDPSVPFRNTVRTEYLQLKAQIPLWRLR